MGQRTVNEGKRIKVIIFTIADVQSQSHHKWLNNLHEQKKNEQIDTLFKTAVANNSSYFFGSN